MVERLLGLTVSGEKGLAFIKNLYREAYSRFEELTSPYKPKKVQLPKPGSFDDWNAEKLEHNLESPELDIEPRQFSHCSYKIASEQEEFTPLLQKNEAQVSKKVTENLFYRHISPHFLGTNSD